MKKTVLLLLLLAPVLVFISCSNSSGNDDDDIEPGNLPDLEFSMTVSGAESHNFEFTLPQGTAGAYASSGAYSSPLQLLTIAVLQVPTGWSLTLSATSASLGKGTFQMNQSEADYSAFANPSSTTAYLSTSGSITITDSKLYAQGPNSIEIHYVTGTFQATLEDNQSNVITITGSFEGVPIGSQ